MSEKPANPPAFPQHPSQMVARERVWGDPGMSLRDWFAGQVLPVVAADIAQDRNECPPADMPRRAAIGAYLYADAMLAAREQSQ